MIFNELNTFGEWSELFLNYKRNKVSNGYFKSLTAAVHHANDFFCDVKLLDITPHQVDDMLYSDKLINYRTHNPLSRKSIKNIRDVISDIFDFALEENPVCRLNNPAKGRKIPLEAGVKKREAISVQLQRLLISYNKHHMYIAVMILLLCGVRRGELIPLKWTDIDFENKLLSVNKSVVEKGNAFIIRAGKAKTETSIRKIPISSMLSNILKKALPHAESEFICSQIYSNSMHTPSSWGKSWADYISYLNKCCLDTQKNINLFTFTPHTLRHTYATILFNAGVDVLTAAKFLGHKNPETTIKIYTHLQKEKISNAVNLYNVYVDDILSTSCAVMV